MISFSNGYLLSFLEDGKYIEGSLECLSGETALVLNTFQRLYKENAEINARYCSQPMLMIKKLKVQADGKCIEAKASIAENINICDQILIRNPFSKKH